MKKLQLIFKDKYVPPSFTLTLILWPFGQLATFMFVAYSLLGVGRSWLFLIFAMAITLPYVFKNLSWHKPYLIPGEIAARITMILLA